MQNKYVASWKFQQPILRDGRFATLASCIIYWDVPLLRETFADMSCFRANFGSVWFDLNVLYALHPHLPPHPYPCPWVGLILSALLVFRNKNIQNRWVCHHGAILSFDRPGCQHSFTLDVFYLILKPFERHNFQSTTDWYYASFYIFIFYFFRCVLYKLSCSVVMLNKQSTE